MGKLVRDFTWECVRAACVAGGPRRDCGGVVGPPRAREGAFIQRSARSSRGANSRALIRFS